MSLSAVYTIIRTRPDIALAISVARQYMSCPGKEHWLALKYILKYLKSHDDLGIVFRSEDMNEGDAMIGFCDSDYAANLDNRRSQYGYILTHANFTIKMTTASIWGFVERGKLNYQTTKAKSRFEHCDKTLNTI